MKNDYSPQTNWSFTMILNGGSNKKMPFWETNCVLLKKKIHIWQIYCFHRIRISNSTKQEFQILSKWGEKELCIKIIEKQCWKIQILSLDRETMISSFSFSIDHRKLNFVEIQPVPFGFSSVIKDNWDFSDLGYKLYASLCLLLEYMYCITPMRFFLGLIWEKQEEIIGELSFCS